MAAAGGELTDQRFVMLGAGSAGFGISSQLIRALQHEGMSETDARKLFFILDRDGLLHESRNDLDELHRQLAQPQSNLKDWNCDTTGSIPFSTVVENAKPTVLVGATGQRGAFSESVIREMGKHSKHPIIFPLSNPTSRAEATPTEILEWTEGRAVIATGSPFAPVVYNGVTHTIAQCNNSYIFPAMGLGIIAAKANRVTNEMFMAAAIALKETSPALEDPTASLLPSLSDVRTVMRKIGRAVAQQAIDDGVAPKVSGEELEANIDQTMWVPNYPT